MLKWLVMLIVSTLLLATCWVSNAYAQHLNEESAPCRKIVQTLEMARCFGSALQSADGTLNTLYGRIQVVLYPSERDRLIVAERTWVQYRDAMCAAERELYGEGTGGNPAHLACLEALTRQQVADLNSTYGWVLKKRSK